jgi:hypothetical protein
LAGCRVVPARIIREPAVADVHAVNDSQPQEPAALDDPPTHARYLAIQRAEIHSWAAVLMSSDRAALTVSRAHEGQPLAPHSSHLRAHIDGIVRQPILQGACRIGIWPRTRFKMLQYAIGDKARALRVYVTVSRAALAVRVEALRHHDVKLIFCARHRYIEEAALFFDFRT